MNSRKNTWLWVAAVFQFITAAMHTIGSFYQAPPANETEAELTKLMSTYRLDLGAGFHPTIESLFMSMSISFTLLCIFGGILNVYLLKRRAQTDILKGIAGIQVIIFGLVFAAMAALTFLIPIIFTGLIFLPLLLSYFALRRA